MMTADHTVSLPKPHQFAVLQYVLILLVQQRWMLVTFLYVIIVLTLTFTVIATCFSFHRKKTDVPYAPAKKTPTPKPKTRTLTGRLSRRFSKKTTKRSQQAPRRINSRQATISGSHPPSSTTAPSPDTKQSSASTELGTLEVSTEAGKTLRVDKTQKAQSYESIKEELGDIQLVKAKGKKNPKDILKDCPKLDKKSSEEGITESSRSYDDTLRGVESLKTDNVLSWIARTSEAFVKKSKTNTETTK